MLARIPRGVDKNVLVGFDTADDAGVYRLTPECALVQTLDFFTPILDSPRLFGAVAAANALSDVYAMGGRPKTAMGILAFPLISMPAEVIVEVLDTVREDRHLHARGARVLLRNLILLNRCSFVESHAVISLPRSRSAASPSVKLDEPVKVAGARG